MHLQMKNESICRMYSFWRHKIYFFRHIDDVIFKEHKFRTLQSLLLEYKNILSNYGYSVSNIKSSYIKDIVTKEFGNIIGFHARLQKNNSHLVYHIAGAASYIEAALSSIEVSDEKLVMDVASCLNKQICQTSTVPWPPYVSELEEKENVSILLLQLLTCIKQPEMHNIDRNPKLMSLASFLSQFVTGHRQGSFPFAKKNK